MSVVGTEAWKEAVIKMEKAAGWIATDGTDLDKTEGAWKQAVQPPVPSAPTPNTP